MSSEERCPKCGEIKRGPYHLACNSPVWHDAASPVDAEPKPVARHMTETALDFEGEIEFMQDLENKTGIFAPKAPAPAEGAAPCPYPHEPGSRCPDYLLTLIEEAEELLINGRFSRIDEIKAAGWITRAREVRK